VAVFVLLFATTLFFIRSDYFRISNIIVIGNKTVRTELVEALVDTEISGNLFFVIPNNHFLFYPREKIIQSLVLNSPRIKEVSLKVDNLSKIIIEITERSSNALWCPEDDLNVGCFLLDDGLAYKSADDDIASSTMRITTRAIPQVILGSVLVLPEKIEKARVFSEYLISQRIPVKKILVESNGDYVVTTMGGLKIFFSDDQEIENIIDNFYSLIQTNARSGEDVIIDNLDSLEYVDLRFDKKIFFKLRE
tara:strand:+ start:1540 stop:2289 length:750 start_codon:yes stop_codon:yes gene_type:complete